MGFHWSWNEDVNASGQLSNDTIDVSLKGCFVGYDTMACVRRSVLTTVMTFTCSLCLLKIARFLQVNHEQTHHYVIFCMAAAESIICSVNWMLSGHFPELDMTATALKVLQVVVLCHFHWMKTWPVLHRETVAEKVWFPLTGIISCYVVAVASLGVLDADPSWTECFKPYWMMLSAADLLVVQLVLAASFHIARRIDQVATHEGVMKRQKRHLWVVVLAFEISAVVSLSYDLTLHLLGNETLGCSGVFAHSQTIYTPVFFLFMIIKFCLPIWSMLYALKPVSSGIAYSEILASGHRENLVVPCVNSSPYRVCGTASYIFDDNVDFLGSSHRRSSTASTSAASSVSASPSVSATGHGPLSTRHLLSVGCVVPTLYIPGHGYVIPPVARPTSGLRTQWSNPRDYWRSRQRLHSTVPSSNRPNVNPTSSISSDSDGAEQQVQVTAPPSLAAICEEGVVAPVVAAVIEVDRPQPAVQVHSTNFSD